MSNACIWLNLDSMPSTLVRKNDNGSERSMIDAGVRELVRQLVDTVDDSLLFALLLLLMLLLSVRRLFDGEQ